MRVALGVLAALVGYFVWVSSFSHLTGDVLALITF